MKNILILICCLICTNIFAWCPGPPPPPHHHYHHHGYYYGCDRGLGNAAAITSIVANSIGILGTICQPRVIAQPVYIQQQPQIIYTQQSQLQPTTVVVQQPAVNQIRQPKQIIIHPDGKQTVIY